MKSVTVITTRSARVVLFSVVSVCDFALMFVCLSVYTIAPELLDISSQHFQGIIVEKADKFENG